MAFYKWLFDGYDPYTQEKWPAPGLWGESRAPRAYRSGWRTVQGSDVCASIPWDRLPVSLWLLEVEGEHHAGDFEVAWEKAKLEQSFGVLRENVVADVAYDWCMVAYETEMLRPSWNSTFTDARIKWIGEQLTNLRGYIDGQDFSEKILDTYPWPALSYAVRVAVLARAGEYKKAWAVAGNIPKDYINKTVRLEMARRLSGRLECV